MLERTAIKNTLYCVGVMGDAIHRLNQGEPLMSIGTPDVPFVEKNHLRPIFSDQWIEGQIIFIDHFENVIVNITREEFEVQTQVLARTRAKVDELERRVAELEATVSARTGS